MDIKGFYKQQKKKKAGGISKPSGKAKPETAGTRGTTPKHPASVGSDVVQPPALVAHDDYHDEEMLLRRFDMDMTYGPCIGMSRISRWERARRMGLNPPKEVEALLRAGKVDDRSLWDDRV